MPVHRHWTRFIQSSIWLAILSHVNMATAYEVPFSDVDYDRQICSGMWAGKDTYINVTYDSSSQGQLSMVIYEWRDIEYLGKITSMTDDSLPQKTYVCTSDAVKGGFCDSAHLGQFILDLPQGKSINDTSFWTARVGFGDGQGTPESPNSEVSTSGFWDNPEGNPTPPDANSDYTTPWKRQQASKRRSTDKVAAKGFWNNPAGNPTPPDAHSKYTTPWFWGKASEERPSGKVGARGFWDNPEGNPTPPDAHSKYTTPWFWGKGKASEERPNRKVDARGFWDNPEGNPTPPDAHSKYTTPWFWGKSSEEHSDRKVSARGFWDNPEGNPTPPDAHSKYTTPWFWGKGKASEERPNHKVNARGFWDNPEGNPTPPDAHSKYTTPWFWGKASEERPNSKVDARGFGDNPEGNPTPPDVHSKYTTPWLWGKAPEGDAPSTHLMKRADTPNPSPNGVLWYKDHPIQYLVRKTGYYCVAIVPVTVVSNGNSNPPRDDAHPAYKGTVLFKNTFNGKLSATEYPKVNFYFAMFIVYAVLGALWGVQCYRNLHDLLPIQYYLSSLLGFLIIEMFANWAYYRYLNAHGRGTTSTVFLIVVAILDAGRNAGSFFLLLVVSLGLSVVRESLGKIMIRCQLLAVAHFIFGVLYAVGIVELEMESTSAFVLLLFVIPLAFTLSGFLLWILYSLNATITQLAARKQRYKLGMFKWLYRILMWTVVMVAIFFVVSSFTFSGRRAEDYGARSWKVQWWLLDGWLSLLFLVDFIGIAYLWRPTPNNRRLAMFDELAQDEEDAEDYDMEALERRAEADEAYRHDDDDTATLVGRGPGSVHDDAVVFEIGDEDAQELSDDEDPAKRQRRQGSRTDGTAHEREGLMKDD
ncbi:hypothetical protein BDW22DRAFT_17032 [Trametopsis cervina]|nr:hypothetical protein BDW22DRAFT_17032 [Trametopsis cervina]